jgi:hypothetical protein
VDDAQLTSVVADDGQMMTRLTLSLRSNGRQFLEIALPPGATAWSSFVAGQPVQPSLSDGKLLLPIEQSAADDGAIPVELTYVGTNVFPHARGEVQFVSPEFDVPVKNARWAIYLPPDYDYKNFAGTMMREIASAPEPVSASFSSLEYSRMEQASQSAAKVEALRDVKEARRQLANGDVSGANATFNRAKAQFYRVKDEGVGFKNLEKSLRKAAASNLVQAQTAFTLRNASPMAGENQLAASQQLGWQYDNAAAARQWTRLQQAQEISAAKVQPLRVNLPVRGLRFAFTQVLQTEAGRPMTIQLFAANDKTVNWPLRGLTAAGMFLALWGLVAFLSHLTLRREGA